MLGLHRPRTENLVEEQALFRVGVALERAPCAQDHRRTVRIIVGRPFWKRVYDGPSTSREFGPRSHRG